MLRAKELLMQRATAKGKSRLSAVPHQGLGPNPRRDKHPKGLLTVELVSPWLAVAPVLIKYARLVIPWIAVVLHALVKRSFPCQMDMLAL